MAKAKTSIKTKKSSPASHIHIALTKKNYMIIGFGVLLIIIGYILMAANSVDGFLPTVVAPILLVAGYCVVIPIGILLKDKAVIEEVTDFTKGVQADKGGSAVVSSNIKTN